MKKQLLAVPFMLLLVVGKSHCQRSIEINISDCRTGKTEFLKELRLYKNDSLYKVILPSFESRQKIRFLPKGAYRIDYETRFGKTEHVQVKTAKRKNKVNICLDNIDHSQQAYVPVIDRLANGESYSIQMLSQGCFHHSVDTLVVQNQGGTYFVQFRSKELKKLTEAEVKIIRNFELELNRNYTDGCTTVDEYIVVYKNETVAQVIDGSCDWDGYYYLMKNLGFSMH